ADDADRRVMTTLAAAERGVPDVDHPLRNPRHRLGRAADEVAGPHQRSADVLTLVVLEGRRDAQEARLANVADLAVGVGPLGDDELWGQGQLLAVTLDHDVDGSRAGLRDGRGGGRPRRHFGAADRDHLVARLEPSLVRRRLRIARGAGAIGLLLRLDALTDRADDGGMDRLVRIAEGHQHSTGQDDGQYDVHGRAAEHDDELLPPRLAVEHAVFVAGPDLFARGGARVPGHGLEQPGAGLAQLAVFAAGLGREHPDHAHV